MAITDITKPMALDETLQGTNTKMDAVILKLQGIIDALGLDTSVYKPKGNITCAALVPALLIDDNLGNVYNVTDNGTTTSDFVEGAGKPIHVGDNVAIVDIGTGGQSEYKFDLLAGMVDLTNYVQKSQTAGLLKNDGTVDTKDYAEKVAGATSGNLAGLNGSGNPTDSGWNGAKDTTSISGNPISISGLKANQLAKDPIITLEPIQAGSGTPSPSNIRAISGYDKVEVESCGVNIWDEEWRNGYYDNNGQFVSNSSYIANKNPIRIGGNMTIYGVEANTYIDNFLCYDKSGTYIGDATRNESNNTRTTLPNTAYINFRCRAAYGGTYHNDVSVNYPASQTTYSPYNKATSISESLGQTVYWGRLNVRTGEFEVIGKLISVLWSASQGTPFTNNTRCLIGTISDAKGGYTNGDISNVAPNASGYNSDTVHFYIHPDNKALVVFLPNGTPDTDVQVCYELADSAKFTIQLTPHEISLLKDYAYVSTNGTNIALDYHNGELASLADVSQLNETVELLNRPPVRKDSINIKDYTTENNAFTCPCDGYIFVRLPSGSGHVLMRLMDSLGNVVGTYTDAADAEEAKAYSVFVKRGIKTYAYCYVGETLAYTYWFYGIE